MNQKYQAWFEKHRPRTIDDLVFPTVLNGEGKDPEYIKEIFKKFYNQEFVQGNVLSYGPGGFGKTSLNKILMGKIIKHPNDIFILGRKVEDVDKLQSWLQSKAISSNQKIVIIEEMDRLSSQAQLVLKDGPLEKYQDKVTFLCTTNNPEKLDRALLTRFNYRLHFQELDFNQTFQRIKNILIKENIEHDDELLKLFVSIYIKRGLRELISNLEVNSVTGKFIFDQQKTLNLTGNEDSIIQIIKYLINYLSGLTKEKVNEIYKNAKSDEHFFQYYNYIKNIIKEDLLLNFDYIYKELMESEIDFGSKSIIIDQYQIIDNVKMKNYHFLNTLALIIEKIQKSKNL
jgi:DNA polymerase III gamma/tau subunit